MADMTVFQTPGKISKTGSLEASCRRTDGGVMPGPEQIGFYLPEYKTSVRLYCVNGGYHLRIRPDGTVDGEREENDVYTTLRIKAVSVGMVVIQGLEASCYLAMDKDGRVYGSKTVNEECVFQEKIEENNYNTYRSRSYGEGNWYLGLKKSGRPKIARRTHLGQKAVLFLPRQMEGTGQPKLT